MSRATKSRFVTKELEVGLILPKENELVGKVVTARGRDLFEVLDAHGEQYLASMPTRFRTIVYVKRGHFVYLMPIDDGDKVKAEITHVLDEETISHLIQSKLWPDRFQEKASSLARDSKRNIGSYIDEDMLPPSSDSDGSTGSDEDEEHVESVYNPNRV